ncbi:MAG: hypothetical protein K0S34_2520, partial [Bacillales bacterium]|nr:hypothetical protein [Bacillales bacterium]
MIKFYDRSIKGVLTMLQTNVISIPAVPLRGMIIFPSTVVHIDVGR